MRILSPIDSGNSRVIRAAKHYLLAADLTHTGGSRIVGDPEAIHLDDLSAFQPRPASSHSKTKNIPPANSTTWPNPTPKSLDKARILKSRRVVAA